jgi:GxxExxY protein
MEIELGMRAIPFVAKKSLRLQYKGRPLQHTYEPDLLCFDKVVVELRAVSALADEHRAQLLNYLMPPVLKLDYWSTADITPSSNTSAS